MDASRTLAVKDADVRMGAWCPVCDCLARPLGLPARNRVHACPRCGHRFVRAAGFDARSAYDDAEYHGFREDPIFERSAWAILKREVVPRLKPGACLLDVGCGNGTVLRVAKELGLKASGIDISATAVEHCRSLGLDAVAGDLPTYDLGNQRFDVVMFWDVLEHLEQPMQFYRRAAELLTPGGLLLTKVPGYGELSVRVASFFPRLAGAVLGVPHHLQLFTHESLRRLLGENFEAPTIMHLGRMRGISRGGPLRRRAARYVVRAIHTASGDATFLLLAHRA